VTDGQKSYIIITSVCLLTHDKNQLITGHCNAQINWMADGWEEVKAPVGTGHMTDIGERLVNVCAANGLKVGGSLF